MKIFLVGMPGCGKSTVGKLLSEKLGWRFLDLDTLLEEQEKGTVRQVFEEKGQDYFRQAEARALRSAGASEQGIVLATGGGAACFHDNMDFMNSEGVSVYLKVSPQDLVQRLTQQDLQLRPLLRDKTPEELISYLAHTLEQRELFYRQAAYTLEVGILSAEAATQALVKLLSMSK